MLIKTKQNLGTIKRKLFAEDGEVEKDNQAP